MIRDRNLARTWRLGLIGGNIKASRSPVLHTVCAIAAGGNASYDLLIPDEFGMSFPEMVEHCRRAGFDGVNVTYPYKEEAAALIAAGDPLVTAMGSSNTLRFTSEGPRAFNTDYTGFVSAFRARFPDSAPGRTLVLGTGGVGRAVVFGLAALGASEILLHDTDLAKVASLSAAVRAQFPGIRVGAADGGTIETLNGVEGVVNCTPLGMVGRPGSPLSEGVSGAPVWGFDAVYTPAETRFRAQVEALGARFLSGWELYFHQGLLAFEIFTGQSLGNPDWVRSVITHKP